MIFHSNIYKFEEVFYDLLNINKMIEWKEKVPILNDINCIIYVMKNLGILYSINNNKEIEDDIKLIQNQIRLLETKYHII